MPDIKGIARYIMSELEEGIQPTDTIVIRFDETEYNVIIELKDESGNWYAKRAIPITVFLSDEKLAKYIKERKN